MSEGEAPALVELSPIDRLVEKLSAAVGPLTFKEATKDLAKKGRGKNAPPPPDFAALLDDLVRTGRAFKHPSGSKGAERFWGRDERRVIRDAVLQAATSPKSLAELKKVGKAAVAKTDKKFADAVVDELVAGGVLHKQGPAKSAPFGREPLKPPHPLEVGDGKKKFAAFVTAATKLVQAVPGVPLDEIVQRLRSQLTAPPPAIPTPTPASMPPPLPLTPERIRHVLKAAYDELCLDVEFQDKVIELRRLYHEAVRTTPELTVEQFHRELVSLQQARLVELKALNEVQYAREPHLAIRQNDRLLYYLLWK